MTTKLGGKVALITGASSGIGEATALALSAEGADISLVARRTHRLESVAQTISTNKGKSLTIAADITDPKEALRAVNETREHFGRVDILVNNAGIMLLGPIDGANIEDWQRMVNINIMGLMYCTHAALPIMKQQGEGHIINMSSVAGRIITGGSAVYNATKWYVNTFSEALRQEVYQDKIRVTSIEPGAVATELTDHITVPEVKDRIKKWIGSMRALTAKDIADTVVFAATQPPHVSINEILVRPTDQSL
ncbi:MAG: SDR family NAD(P)-dependent oxidoreductase [Candidatus Obscuribacterales bacterium]|nr:SDR family NAD(P)-dependent oxidoreductase [Candidatus Obscuribacterales bacterium]